MSRPIWFVELVKKVFPSRFLLAQATRFPPLAALIDRWLFFGDQLYYLPQDHVIPIDRPIDHPGEMVLPSQVVEHFIREAHVHWLMNSCICRDANGCEGYPIELGCLFLGEAATGINPKLGRRVTEEEALTHLECCREAGLVHMVGRNKLDEIWLGVRPGERLLTICNCCPCCCLWRVLPSITPQIGVKVRRMPGVCVTVSDLCIGCGTCVGDICFVDAIQLVGNRSVISDACRGCGRCVTICPQDAIELTVDISSATQQVIDQIGPLVDLS